MGGVFVLAFLLLIPLILVLTIILFATRKSSEPFESKLRTIYCYLILLISIVAIIISIILVINNIIEIIIPDSENTNMNSYYRNFITSTFSIIIFIPVTLYHSKKIKN